MYENAQSGVSLLVRARLTAEYLTYFETIQVVKQMHSALALMM